MRIKNTDAKRKTKRKVKQEAMNRHRDRMRRLDQAKGKLVQSPDPKVDIVQPKPTAEPKQKAEPKTASISKEDLRNMYHRKDWENQPHILPFFDVIIAFFKLFFKLIELSLGVIGVYVGETRRHYKKLLRQKERMTDAELEDDIYNTLSNYTSSSWLIFSIRNSFKAFWNMRELAGDMITLITIKLKRDRRIQILVLGVCLLIGFGVMYLYGLFSEILFIYTFIQELLGLH